MKNFFLQITELNWWSKVAVIGLVISFIILFNGQARQSWQLLFRPAERDVLSTISVDLFGKNQINRIVKIRTPENILLEIYAPLENDTLKLIETITISDRHDGYYHLLGQAVNLAVKDMDGDRLPEIVAPTYDAEMKAHLNIFKFNQEIQRFEPYDGASH